MVGGIEEVDARTSILFPTVRLIDSGATSTRETPDQVTVLGRTWDGCELVADVNGGIAPDEARFELEVRGSDGWLKLSGGFPFGFQAADLELTSSAAFDPPARPAAGDGIPPPAINVGEVYARLAADMRAGTRETPGFDHAVRMSRMIDRVREAASSGTRQRLPAQ